MAYRRLIHLALLLATAALAGCGVCQAPFDYCAPVIGPNGCPNCNFLTRRGSLFAPTDDTPASPVSTPTPAISAGDADDAAEGSLAVDDTPTAADDSPAVDGARDPADEWTDADTAAIDPDGVTR